MYTEVLLERWFWLSVSVFVALFVSWANWAWQALGRKVDKQLLLWLESPLVAPGYQVARILYAVGFPILLLLGRGALSQRGLGLQTWSGHNITDWASDLGWVIGISVGLWGMITLSEHTVCRITGTKFSYHHDWGIALREAIYHQVHWAFYREPFILLWPTYGVWGGLLPTCLEALGNPARWRDLSTPQRARDLLIRAAFAVASGLIYLQTQNLWLAIASDMTLGLILGYSPKPKPRPELSTPPT